MAKDTATGTITQLFVGLVWLGTTMYTAHVTITGGGEIVSGALGAAVRGLPGVVAATLVTGASIGAAAGSRVPERGRAACSPASPWVPSSAWPPRPASGSRTAVGRPSWCSRSPSARRASSAVPWPCCPARC
jgi:hypothetical protein